MPGDPVSENFLGSWLAARMREQAVAKPAQELYGALSILVQGEVLPAFRRGLTERISGLKALIQRLDAEDDRPIAENSIRGRWLQAAREIAAARWDEARWDILALELTGAKNPILLAAVSQSIAEAVEQGRGGSREIVPARKLRVEDEREFRSIPVPPGHQASWCDSAYLFPLAGRALVTHAASALADAEGAMPPDSPARAHARILSDLFELIEAGWPVPRAKLEASLEELARQIPEGSGPGTVLREALQLVRPDLAPAGRETPIAVPATAPSGRETQPPTPPATGPEAILRRATAGLDQLARDLLSAQAPEAQDFGRRLRDLIALPEARTAPGLHQELVGCLSFLDESDRSGTADRWRRSALERMARIAQTLDGGEVLDDRLLGQPLSRWTEFITFVGYDDDAPPGEPRRITRVERVGYVLVFSDGTRKALVRARVRLAM